MSGEFSYEVRNTKLCRVEGCDKPVRARKMCITHWSEWRKSASQDEVRSSDPEVRFQRATRWGEPPSYRPELGPCLIYLGADNGNGYGQFAYNKRNGYAHRYAWERVHGPIPNDLTVDHLCRVRCCVNVEHMELTERVENYLRGVATRHKCPNGHEYTPDNLYTKKGVPSTVRLCKKCKEDTSRREGLRRSKAFSGTPRVEQRKFDPDERDRLVIEVVERRMTVAQAATQLGAAYKYIDKLVMREAKARGIPDRRKHRGPILFDGWTENKTRIVVRERSNGVCERCDRARATDMHHRKNRSQSGKWHPANIMHLCTLCHVEITAEPEQSHIDGFTVLSTEDPASVPVRRRGERVLLTDGGEVVAA